MADDLTDIYGAFGGAPSAPAASPAAVTPPPAPALSSDDDGTSLPPLTVTPRAASDTTPAAPAADLSDVYSAFSPDAASAPAATTPVQQERNAMGSVLSNLDTAVRGAARAIPFMDDIAAAGNTAFSYLPNAVKAYVPGANPADQSGEPFTQRYKENLARERAINQADDADRPIPSYGGQIAGALALPAVGADAIATKAATVAPQFLADTVGAATAGAGYGALYGAGQGNGFNDRLQRAETGAVLGGVTGALAPAVVSGLGAATKPFQAALNPEAVAASRIGDVISRDASNGMPGLSATDVTAARQANQAPALVDVGGETTKALARAVANQSPEARAQLADLANQRFETQGTRFSDFMNGMFGGNLDSQAVRDQLAQQAKTVNTPAYQAAYRAGDNGVWDEDLANLVRSPHMASAVQDAQTKAAHNAVMNGQPIVKSPFVTDAAGNVSLAQKPNGEVAYPTLRYWDQVKRSLDGKINVAQRAGDRETAADLTGLKQALVAKLDAAVPAYGTAREGAYRFFGAENALDAGEKFFTMSKSADIAGMKKSLAQMTPAQKELFARGLASQIAQKALNASSRRDVVKLFDAPQTREKLQLGLGQARSDQIEAYLRREAIIDRLRTALGNSTTARQGHEAGLTGGAAHGVAGMISGALSSPMAGAVTGAGYAYHEHGADPLELGKYAALGAMSGLFNRYAKGVHENVLHNMGRMLSSDDPAVVAQVTKAISRNKNAMNSMRDLSERVSRLTPELQ